MTYSLAFPFAALVSHDSHNETDIVGPAQDIVYPGNYALCNECGSAISLTVGSDDDEPTKDCGCYYVPCGHDGCNCGNCFDCNIGGCQACYYDVCEIHPF